MITSNLPVHLLNIGLVQERWETRETWEGQQDARVTWQYSSQDALAGGDEGGGGTHINQHIPVGLGLRDTSKLQLHILIALDISLPKRKKMSEPIKNCNNRALIQRK